MYLHLGQSVVVPESSIIGVFDLDNTTGSHITRNFLEGAERAGRVLSVSEELPKSFIVCDGTDGAEGLETKTVVYLSQLTSLTLMKRSEALRFD